MIQCSRAHISIRRNPGLVRAMYRTWLYVLPADGDYFESDFLLSPNSAKYMHVNVNWMIPSLIRRQLRYGRLLSREQLCSIDEMYNDV